MGRIVIPIYICRDKSFTGASASRLLHAARKIQFVLDRKKIGSMLAKGPTAWRRPETNMYFELAVQPKRQKQSL
jgi:hypothetical protein